MADTSSFMDWHPQTPPPVHNPYQGEYMPGGWPVDPLTPPPPTTCAFLPPRRHTAYNYVLPTAKRVCSSLTAFTGLGFHAATEVGKRTVDATTIIVVVPAIHIVRQCQARRRKQRRLQRCQRPLPPLSQSPWNRAVAGDIRRPPPLQHVVFETPPARTAKKQITMRATPHPKKQEAVTEDTPYEVPEFRPDYVLSRISKNATLRQQMWRRLGGVLSGMPQLTPPRETKPLIPTPEEKVQELLPECAKLRSPYPQLIPTPVTPPSPVATVTSNDSATPSAQLQGDLYAATESDSDGVTVVSSITQSRKRRIDMQSSRTTEDGETPANAKRVQTESPNLSSPKTPTPAIVVQDAPSSASVGAPTPVNTSLLSPPRLRLRKVSTPKAVKTPKTPKTPLSDISSTCDVSPGNYQLDPARSPIKSEISSFFDGSPPQNPEQDAHVFRMITAGGGSPTPASTTIPESVTAEVTTGSNARDAQVQALGETSNAKEFAVEETQGGTLEDLASTSAEVTSEMTDMHLGLANQGVLRESNDITEAEEQENPSHDAETAIKGSPRIRIKQQTMMVAPSIDLTNDKETSESSPSATSIPQTPERQFAGLKLDDLYTPDQPTPKASPHSAEKTQRRTRAESKRIAFLEEKHLYNLVPLTEEWEKQIQTVLRHGHGNFKASDFTRVVPLSTSSRGTDQWLNDEVINGYLELVIKHGKKNDRGTQVPTHHAFSSFFFSNLESRGYDSVKRWAAKAKIGGKRLLETEAVFIPINSGAHWTLCVVSGKNHTVTHYNSMRGSGRRYISAVKTWLAAELGSSYKEDDWTFVESGESPLQNNMDDCGVFTITSARQIMLGLTPMSYTPAMIPLQRKRIVAELVAGELLKSNV